MKCPNSGARDKPASVDELEESALIRRVRQRDGGAFEELYRRYGGMVFAFLLRCASTRQDAEDLTQEVFVRAWEKIDQFEERSRFSTWLIGIALGFCKTSTRSARRRQQRDTDWYIRGSYDAENALDELIDLERAIARLPLRAKSVLVLRSINGFRYSEIAKMMKITEGACKAHMNHAMRRLRKELSK